MSFFCFYMVVLYIATFMWDIALGGWVCVWERELRAVSDMGLGCYVGREGERYTFDGYHLSGCFLFRCHFFEWNRSKWYLSASFSNFVNYIGRNDNNVIICAINNIIITHCHRHCHCHYHYCCKSLVPSHTVATVICVVVFVFVTNM